MSVIWMEMLYTVGRLSLGLVILTTVAVVLKRSYEDGWGHGVRRRWSWKRFFISLAGYTLSAVLIALALVFILGLALQIGEWLLPGGPAP